MASVDNTTLINRSNESGASLTMVNNDQDFLIDRVTGSEATTGSSALWEVNDSGIVTNITWTFKRLQTGNWYDDDYTDAEFVVYFFFNTTAAGVSHATGAWDYNMPDTTGHTAFDIKFKKDPNGSSNPHAVFSGMTASNIVQNSAFEAFDGTNQIKIEMVANGTGAQLFVYDNDAELKYSADIDDFDMTTISSMVFGVHHHNYGNASDERLNDFSIEYTSSLLWKYSGNVYKEANVPAVRDIYFHDQATGAIVASTTTDQHGYFEVVKVDPATLFARIVDPADIYQPEIRENLVLAQEVVV